MKTPSPDSADELRAGYRRYLERRGTPDRGACPDPEALLGVVERSSPEPDRLEVLDHVMQCPACLEELELLRRLERSRPSRRAGIRPWLAAAASMAILLGAGYGVWRGVGDRGGRIFRGPNAALELLSPGPGQPGSGSVNFLWRSVPGAFEYHLEILDPQGEPLFDGVTPDTTFLLDLGDHPRVRGDVAWWVRARLRDGTERASETRRLALPGD